MISLPLVVWWASGYSLTGIRGLFGPARTKLFAGLLLGLLMTAIILGGYYAFLQSRINPAGILSKVQALGILRYYWVMALFISLAHSLFEEYFWRVFILTQLARWIRGTLALSLVAGIIFGIHHIFAMYSLFDWPIVVLCVMGTMAAGFIWSRMRLVGYSIWDCYLSHVFADLAVMWIGYDLLLKAQ
jgi:membrane protease YdiL (CAAX protease family)